MPYVDRSLGRLIVLVLGVLAASVAIAAGGVASAPAAPAKQVPVKAIQRALGIRADGVMGPRTRRAIKRFQRAHGLKADGVAGPATLAALGLTTPEQDRELASADPATVLAQIAECESGGNLAAVSADGRYFGKYQFSQATWDALGGTGSPAEADEPTQDALAGRLYAERGLAPWPACASSVQATG